MQLQLTELVLFRLKMGGDVIHTRQLPSKAEDLHDPVARKNFRLVVIVPDSVEQTDLSDPEKARRFRYTFDDSSRANAGWRTEELWP